MKLKFLSSLLIITSLFSTANANEITDEFDDYIRQEMQQQKIPAYAALIFQGDKILHEVNFGLANIKQKQPLTPDHVFLMGSVSKMLTAVALLQLYDQHQFDLDDEINDYLSFSVNIPNQTTAITFRMLLTHTAAIADGPALDDQYYYGEDSPVKLDYYLKNYFTPKGKFYSHDNFHNFEPGTQYKYTNEGSALIGLLVEQISGIDFAQFTQQNMFKPLGMNNTHWHLKNIKAPIVTLYDYGDYVENLTFTDYPNGGLRSSARDMHKFLAMLGNQGSYNGMQILNPSTVDEMLSYQISNISPNEGLQIHQLDDGTDLWGHEGGEAGTSTFAGVNPETQIGIVLLTNISDGSFEDAIEAAYITAEDLINFSKYD